MAYCPVYRGAICSLCCSLDARCLDACKPGARLDDYLEKFARCCLPASMRLSSRLRLLRFALSFVFLSTLTAIFIGIIYYQDLLYARQHPASFHLLFDNFFKVYCSLLVFIGLSTWWLILNHESRRVAHEETARQTQLLLTEIEEHKKTDAKLQQAMKTADNANSAKSRFLSNMSHEIRTPLNCIVGYSHILHNDPSLPQHRREAVTILKRSGEHLAALIEDILDIAGIEARKFDLRYAAFDFPDFIEHLVSVFKTQAEDKGLSFHCQADTPLPKKIRGDEKRIRQILINLLNNAVKFTDAGDIILRIGYRGEVATFQVIDSGEGIAEKELELIFQPFIRLGQTAGKSQAGSGLGLTLSKILTELMGGELTVVSRPGHGSTFTVRLLLANLKNIAKPLQEANIIGFQEPSRNILVVDDQPEQRNLLAALLEPLGFHVARAESGEACLLQVAHTLPDLILLDLTMAGISGIETAKRLRRQKRAMPILVISANAYAGDRQAAITAGCNDFLAKPLQIGELLGKLKLHLHLNWIYEDKTFEPVKTPTSGAMIIPPPNVIAQLLDHVQIGDILNLKLSLNELIKSESGYRDFALRIRNLATEFRIADIKKTLNAHIAADALYRDKPAIPVTDKGTS